MFKDEIIKILGNIINLEKENIKKLIEVPPNSEMGDYAFPCFSLAKEMKKSPNLIAQELVEKIKPSENISEIKAIGAYLNFFVNKEKIANYVLTKIYNEKDSYGKGNANKNYVIEFCGPNTNKPLHLGHVRNMALGNAMCDIIKFNGNEMHKVNIVNDRGIHISQSMLAYQKWGNNKEPDKKGDHFVGDFYVMYANAAKENEELKNEAQEMLKEWEKENPEIRKLWEKMNKWVLEGFAKTYKRFGIKFEKEYFESEYFQKAKEIVKEGIEKKVFIKDDEDAIIAPLEKYNLPNKVILRPDDTSLYFTQDLYLAELRQKDFNFDKLIYVVASEQELHFQMLFKVLEILGKKYAKNLHHLSYGLVNLPDGRMKSREGTVIDADDIMDETAKIAENEIKKRNENLDEKIIKDRAEKIALGAIKFYMVKTEPIKSITFNPEESLSFEGETGPYLQYTHARASSILRKLGNKVKKEINFSKLDKKEEIEIIKILNNFPQIIEQTAEKYKPHFLANYLITLSQTFNEFYHKYQVISDDKEITKARILLVSGTKQILKTGLNLLGINPLEEM
jgi:arginyl-tRNA synthetase